ncbi:HK97 family phage prohead protease [Clostridium tetani]|uniref:HK97 family phage prohead protease n=1 Tax=Clostridium tetani TaxID=1513 RepID=UPI00100ABBC8|nr:HK97 family phage prohead protease [Clostridium tetani]RXI50188.1 HK97 family phage prohead protease [Clostridium tetani]
MRIEIRNYSVILDGYVNVVKRDSRPIPSVKGKFIEQIEPRAFEKALERAENVDLLLNHDKNKHLGSTKEGNLRLFEDNIGLRAIATITNEDVIEKAKNKQLRGWSFGFYGNKDRWEDTQDGIQRRFVQDLDIFEVSIIDNTKKPAYIATSIETRNDEEVIVENRCNDFKAVVVDETIKEPEERQESIDYSKYENIIKNLGGK